MGQDCEEEVVEWLGGKDSNLGWRSQSRFHGNLAASREPL